MKSNLVWKFLLVVFVVAWSINEFWPPQGRPLLEVFEQRAQNKDDTFKAIVAQAAAMQATNSVREFGNLWDAVGTNNIARYFPTIPTEGEKDPRRAILQRLQKQAAGKVRLGLDLQGGTMFVVGVDTGAAAEAGDAPRQTELLSQAIEVLRKRVDKFGVAEPIIQPQGDDRISIQLPGLSQSDLESARVQIEKAAVLHFRLVHPESDRLVLEDIPEPGYEFMDEQVRDPATGKTAIRRYLVGRKPELGLTGKYIESAMASRDQVTGKPEILFTFNNEGAELFGQLTGANIGRQLAIVLDGELYSAPVIQGQINKNGRITGNFTLKEAIDLSNILENPLETPVKILEERSVDPSLGRDSIQKGIRANLIGLTAVVVFMLGYYLVAGVVANVALALNIILLLGVFCSIDATLTLPGIAGILLTIGMAVDANVLIFERIREELQAGKSLRGALNAGYDRAFGTIFDANITTLIASLLLIKMGTGPVKGFGVTLTIGVLVSMFTALFVTRLVFDFLLAKGVLKSLPMLRLIGHTRFDFLKLAKPAFVLSWMLVIAGVLYGMKRGSETLGPDLKGGTVITLEFQQKVQLEDVRKAVSGAAKGEPSVQFQRDLATGKETLRILAGIGSEEEERANPVDKMIENAISTAFPQAGFKVVGVDKVGPTIGKEILSTAIWASLIAMFGILVYVAFRYEFSFAVGAVVAVLHDVLMTLGWYCLTGREFDSLIVPAILTIIGFSINDTIVIFDRIREDLKMGVRGSFKEIINTALNQTLSRTVITSGTVFLSTASLYLFGGSAINPFAFAFLVGILTGTYSSIYIASALVLWWHKGKRPTIGGPSAGGGAASQPPVDA